MIFLDNNATTPILQEVVAEMLLDLDGIPRNPSSITTFGREAKQKIIQSKDLIGTLFGLSPQEISFTSGGTESNHMLIQGFYKRKPGAVITTMIEHSSALEPIKQLGCEIIYLEVDQRGTPTLDSLKKALRPSISFIFLSGANSETGALLSLQEFADLAYFHQVPLLIDGVQLLGKSALFPLPKGVSGLSLSAHKCHGPKGIGLAIIRKPYKISPLFRGGHQENNMRAGTENLPAILGFTKALSLISPDAYPKINGLRNQFEDGLINQFPYIQKNVEGTRLCNTSNLYFQGIDAESLLIKLDQKGVIASLGSACSSGSLEPSHVLLGMGYSRERALGSLRFSLSRLTTQDEIKRSLNILSDLLCR